MHGIWITNYFYNTTNGGVFGSSSGNFNNLRIASSSNSGDAYGICGSYTPKEDQSYDVILKVAGDLDVSAQSETGNAYGIHLSGKSDVLFTGNVNILASAAEGKEAQAIYAEGSALNFTGERIALTGDVLVNNGGKVVIGRTAELLHFFLLKTKASLLQTSAHPLLRSTATCPFLVRASSFSRTTRK